MANMATTETESARAAENELARRESNKHIINLAGDTVAVALKKYPEEHAAALGWLFHWAKENGHGYEEISKQIDISATTIYRMWKGEYVNPSTGDLIDISKQVAKIVRFRELTEERDAITRLPFIETSVWKRIDKVCREAQVGQTFAFVYGESQIGKTASLKEYARRNNHGQTIYVLMPASAGVQAMMKAIAHACHIGVRTDFEQLRERVTACLDGNKLLIIDEVHEVFVSYQKTSMVKCLSVIRQLQERTNCGMVLAGTNVFRTEMESGEFAQSLKQLRKRGIWEVQLESVPRPEDLAKIAEFYKLGTAPGPVAEAVKLIAHNYGLGKYIKFIQRAGQLAKTKGERFTWQHFARIVSIAAESQKQLNAGNN